MAWWGEKRKNSKKTWPGPRWLIHAGAVSPLADYFLVVWFIGHSWLHLTLWKLILNSLTQIVARDGDRPASQNVFLHSTKETGGLICGSFFYIPWKEQFTQNSKISRYPLPLRMLKFRSPQNRKTAMNSWSSWRQCPDLFYYFPSLVAVCFHVKMSAREDESFMCTCVL